MLLPLREPAIKATLDYGFIFGMRNENVAYNNFLMSNYSGVCFITDSANDVWDPFDFHPAPRMKQMTQAGMFIAQAFNFWASPKLERNRLGPFLKDQLNEGKYIYAVVDHFFLKGTLYYALKHFPHHGLIVGYRSATREFALAGYYQKRHSDLTLSWKNALRNAYYGVEWIPEKDLARAIYYDPKILTDNSLLNFSMWSHKYIETYEINDEAHCVFDPIEFAKDLKAYLDSVPRPERSHFHHRDLTKAQALFGIATYSHWEKLLRAVCNKEYRRFIHISVRVFWEHKHFLLEKVLHAREALDLPISDSTLARLRALTKAARRFRFIYIEAGAAGQTPPLDEWTRSLHDCRALEEEVYTAIYEQLCTC